MPLVVLVVVLLALALAEGTPASARRSTPSAATRRRPRAAGIHVVLVQLRRLCPRRRLLRPRRRVHQRADRLRRSADRQPMLLQIFAAVVVGGTLLGGGRGGPVGSVFGAYILMIVVNILLVLNVSAYYQTIAEGTILILAVLAASICRMLGAGRAAACRAARACRVARRHPAVAARARGPRLDDRRPSHGQRSAGSPRRSLSGPRTASAPLRAAGLCLPSSSSLVVTQIWLGHTILQSGLLQLADRAVLLPRRPGARPGHGDPDRRPRPVGALDDRLSRHPARRHGAAAPMRRLSTRCRSCWRSAALIGLVNGVGIVVLGLSPIVMTLAMNGILQGAALLYRNGTPAGFSSPLLRWFMTGQVLGLLTPVVLLRRRSSSSAAVLLLGRTPFGRRVYGSATACASPRLSGIGVERTLIGVYVLSALLRGPCRHPAHRLFAARRASAWATNISCRRSPWWWSAAR